MMSLVQPALARLHQARPPRAVAYKLTAMSDNLSPADGDRAAASTRTLEIAVALILFVLGAIVVFDSYRLGLEMG